LANFRPSHQKEIAPLICRVVRAVLMLGAGLGFPVGAPAVFTPNLRLYYTDKTRLSLIGRLGVGDVGITNN